MNEAAYEIKTRLALRTIRALGREFGKDNVYWNDVDGCLSMETKFGVYNLRLSRSRDQVIRANKVDKYV